MDYKDAVLYYDLNGVYKHLVDGFGKFSPAYTMSNEFLGEAMAILNPQGKSILTVAGSGDQPFFYKIYGASHVDTFDISYCAKVVMDVKTAAVQSLSHRRYKKFMGNIKSASIDIDSVNEYREISPCLSNNVRCFVENMHGCRYRLNAGIQRFNIPSVKMYARLKRCISGPFNFIWSDVMNLSGCLTQKYDQIYLSNILQYNCDKDKITNLIISLLPAVNKGGEIVLYVTPFVRLYELRVFAEVEKLLQNRIKMRMLKTRHQQYLVINSL